MRDIDSRWIIPNQNKHTIARIRKALRPGKKTSSRSTNFTVEEGREEGREEKQESFTKTIMIFKIKVQTGIRAPYFDGS